MTCDPDKAPRKGMQRRKRRGRETREPDGQAVGGSVARQTRSPQREREGHTDKITQTDPSTQRDTAKDTVSLATRGDTARRGLP